MLVYTRKKKREERYNGDIHTIKRKGNTRRVGEADEAEWAEEEAKGEERGSEEGNGDIQKKRERERERERGGRGLHNETALLLAFLGRGKRRSGGIGGVMEVGHGRLKGRAVWVWDCVLGSPAIITML